MDVTATRRLVPLAVVIALALVAAGGAALGLAQAPSVSKPTVGRVRTAPVAPPTAPTITTTPPPTAPPAPSLRLGTVAFFDPQHGYGVFTRTDGPTCTALVGPTGDGGADFAALVSVTSWPCGWSAPATSLAFDDHGDGFLYGPGLFVTHDAGATWSPNSQPGQVLSVEALGESVWMVEADCPGGQGSQLCPIALLESTDGGRTWSPSPSLPPGATGEPYTGGAQDQTPLVRVSVRSAYLVTNPGLGNPPQPARLWFTSDGGASWSARSPQCAAGPYSTVLSAAPDGTLWSACADEPGAGFQSKVVARSFDGGRTWITETEADCLQPPSPQVPPACRTLDSGYLGGVDAVSATRAFMVGDRLPLLVTNDGGETWTATAPGGSGGGSAHVIFFDADHGLVLGDDPNNDEIPTLWTTSDGGQHWSSVMPSAASAVTGNVGKARPPL